MIALDALIDGYLDGQSDAEQSAELERQLVSDESVAARFAQRALVHALMFDRTASVISTPKPQPVATSRRAPRFSLHAPIALAAALLVCAAVAAIYFIANASDAPDDPQSNPRVATLVDATSNVMIDDELARPGADYASGTYAIKSGSAEFLLSSMVAIEMRGRSQLAVHSNMRTTLMRGSARFDVPAGAIGFTVDLPTGARIVDLGTAFDTVVADEGAACLRVLKGRVEATGRDKRAHLLDADERAHVGPGGGIVVVRGASANDQDRIVSPTNASFESGDGDWPDGWAVGNEGPGGFIAWEHGGVAGHGGRSIALRVENNVSTADTLSQTFAVIGDDRLVMSFAYRTERNGAGVLDGTPLVQLRFWADAERTRFLSEINVELPAGVTPGSFTEPAGWPLRVATTLVPAAAVVADVRISANLFEPFRGTARFDDLVITTHPTPRPAP